MIRNEDLHRVKALALEVAAMCDAVLAEAWQVEKHEIVHGEGMHRVNGTPDHPGGTRKSAALRRRTLDLSMALAQLRNPRMKK